MKKASQLIIVSMLLVVATLFCSCGGLKDAKPNSVLSGDFDAKTFSTAEKLEMDSDCVKESGKLILLVDSESKKMDVYNLVENKIVYTITETDTSSIYDVSLYELYLYGHGLFTVTVEKISADSTETVYETTLYNDLGEAITTADDKDVTVNIKFDLLVFDDKCYRINEKGAYKTVCEFNELTNKEKISNFTTKTAKYYYSLGGAAFGTLESLTVYDKNLEYVSSYEFPSYSGNRMAGVVDDGKVLIQYSVETSDDDEKYDYMDESRNKYKLVTGIFDVKSEKLSEFKSDFVFLQVSSRCEAGTEKQFEMFTKGVKNIGVVYEIVDGRIEHGLTSNNVKAVVVNSDGKVKSSVSDMFPGMTGDVESVAKDLYTYSTLDGAKYLAKKSGKTIGEVTKAKGINSKYILGETKLYDLDMKVDFDFSEKKLSYMSPGVDVDMTKSGVFFEDEDGSVYFYNGELKEIISKSQAPYSGVTVHDEYFVVSRSSDGIEYSYICYAADGTPLITTSYQLSLIASYEDIILYCGEKDGKNVYYRVTK